jgi:hypothetical protein
MPGAVVVRLAGELDLEFTGGVAAICSTTDVPTWSSTFAS